PLHVVEAHQDIVNPAAIEAGDDTGRRTERSADKCGENAYLQRDAGTKDETGKYVTAHLVRTEEIPRQTVLPDRRLQALDDVDLDGIVGDYLIGKNCDRAEEHDNSKANHCRRAGDHPTNETVGKRADFDFL